MRQANQILNDIEARLDWRSRHGGTAENPDMILLLEAVAWLLNWVHEFETETGNGHDA